MGCDIHFDDFKIALHVMNYGNYVMKNYLRALRIKIIENIKFSRFGSIWVLNLRNSDCY